MRVQVQVPVRLVVEPGALRGDALGELETKLGAELRKAWLTAQREVAADGFAGTPRLRPTSFDWSGPGRRALDERERRQVERRLLAVIRGASTTVLMTPPTRAWQVHPPIEFKTRFDKFVHFVRAWWRVSYLHELRARAGENYTDEVKATAWVIDVNGDVPLLDVLNDVAAARVPKLGAGPFLLFRNREHARRLRALNPGRLARLPALKSDEPVIASGLTAADVTLRAGMRLVFAAAAEPAPSTVPIADFAPPFDVVVTFGELFTHSLPTVEAIQQKYGVVHWGVFLDLYFDWTVTVRVQRFTVVRQAHGSVVRRLVMERAQQDEPGAPQFGRLVRLAHDDLGALPEGVADLAKAWVAAADAAAAAVAEIKPAIGPKTKPAKKIVPPSATVVTRATPDWQPGERGLLVTPVLEPIRGRILAANRADSLRAEAKELAHILLNVKDDFWGPDKLRALEKFLLNWRSERPKPMMEVLFAELDRLHAFTELYDLLYRKYSLYGWMRVAVIGNATGTRFEQRPEVQRLVAAMNVIRREIMSQITWDPVTNDLVFVHSGKHLSAAGLNYTNPNAGVIGWVEPYFTNRGVISRPTKATMDKLAEPTRKKVQDLMLAMMCGKGETRTREQLITEAIQAAAAELKLDPEKDFERVTARFSFRVTTVDRRTEHGLDAVYVTLQPVQKLGDDNWEDAGPPKTPITLAALDAELVSIHVDRQMAALTVLFLVQALLLGGGYVIITGGWLGATGLVIAISIREIIYVWTTPEADRDLSGYLTQALYGVIDVIGFRLGALAATKIAGRLVTQQVLQQAATKWVIYASKGIASATALGTSQVVVKFADDILHLSHCRRWSSPSDYLKEFGTGFAIGLAFEFAIAPALTVAGRALVRTLAGSKTGAKEVAEGLAKQMRPEEIAEVAEQGVKNLEQALVNTFKPEKAGLVKGLVTAIREHVKEVVEHARVLKEPKGLVPKLRAEWTSRATKDLFDAAKLPLGKNALTGVEILVRTTTREEMNTIVGMLLREPPLRELLEASPKVGVQLLTRSLKGAFKTPGELTATVDLVLRAPRLRAFLEAQPEIGAQLITRTFGASRDVMESFLEQIAKLPAREGNEVIAALLRIPRLSLPETHALARVGESAAGRLGGFLRIAEIDEIHYLLRLVSAHQQQLEKEALGELLRLGASQPRRFGEVVSALDHRLAHGSPADANVVRDLFARSRHAAEAEALQTGQRALRKDVTPGQASKSIDKDVRFGERKEDLPALHKDDPRLRADLERARIERERYEIMKTGDPARGGERRPLAFENWNEYDAFKDDFGKLVEQLADGKPIRAQGQVIGTSTSFYSGNPDKPLGHYFDRNAPRARGDVDVDLFSPQLVERMVRAGGASANEKVLVGGERTIFKNQGAGGSVGFHDQFPAVPKFIEKWSTRLGREVDVKLRLDLDLPPKPKTGPIEFFRKETE